MAITDARESCRLAYGRAMSPDQWRREGRITRLAQQRGFKIPAANFVQAEAVPARALLNHGRWVAWCPDCVGAAEDVWRAQPVFWCMRCGNRSAQGYWRPVLFPENLAEIEAILAPFPSQAQHWEPWGPKRDLAAEAQAWVEHAAVMTDPEHGLTANEVGGADDPETYTTPVIAVTNAIITSSDANVDKGDLRYFRQYLSANPGGSGYWLESTGADGGGWVARLTALANAFAAGTISAGLAITGAFSTSSTSANSIVTAGGISANGLVAAAGGFAGGSANVTTTGQVQAGSADITGNADIDGTATLGAAAVTNNATVGGTLGVTGTATVGAVSTAGTIVTSSASGSAINASAGGISAAGNLGVTGSGTFGGTVQGTRFISTIATGTAPFGVSSTTLVSNLNAQLLNSRLADTVPTANTVPISDGSGLLDGWISGSAGVPSGLGGWVRKASEIPSGFSRESSLDGRIPVGAGTTFTVTYVEETNYGTSWSFTPTDSGHSHGVTNATVTGSTGVESATNGLGNGGGTTTPAVNHTHSSGTLDVGGTTDGGNAAITSTTWTIPSRGVVFVRKN